MVGLIILCDRQMYNKILPLNVHLRNVNFWTHVVQNRNLLKTATISETIWDSIKKSLSNHTLDCRMVFYNEHEGRLLILLENRPIFLDKRKSFHKARHDELFELLGKLDLFRKSIRTIPKVDSENVNKKPGWIVQIDKNRDVKRWCAFSPDLFNLHSQAFLYYR